jgi:hypothetical protein
LLFETRFVFEINIAAWARRKRKAHSVRHKAQGIQHKAQGTRRKVQGFTGK